MSRWSLVFKIEAIDVIAPRQRQREGGKGGPTEQLGQLGCEGWGSSPPPSASASPALDQEQAI